MRVKRGVSTHKTHRNIRKQTKGMQKARRRSIRLARQAVIRSLQYSYRDRRNRKRDMRKLWTTQINAAARNNNTTYSQLINGIHRSNIELDRKILAKLAATEPKVFKAVVDTIS